MNVEVPVFAELPIIFDGVLDTIAQLPLNNIFGKTIELLFAITTIHHGAGRRL